MPRDVDTRTLVAGTEESPPLVLQDGDLLVVPGLGAVEYSGGVLYLTAGTERHLVTRVVYGAEPGEPVPGLLWVGEA